MGHYSTLSVDELLAEGARLEKALQRIAAEYDPLASLVDSEEDKLKTELGKLGLTALIAAGGIATTPITLGWSLLVTVGPAALATWELIEWGIQIQRLRSTQQQLRKLLVEAKGIDDALLEIRAEIDSRT